MAVSHIRMKGVPPLTGPGDIFVVQFNLLQVVVLLFSRVFDVMHHADSLSPQ